MIKCVSEYITAIISIMIVLSFACNNGTGPKSGPDNSPILSNISALDSVYAGYYRLYDPPCTLRVSFNYNASKVSSLDVSATLDSGKLWFPVATVTPNGSNTANVVWPLNNTADTGHFNYFGFKECYLKITDKTSDTSINSQTFNIIGNAPFILTSPVGGETFSVSDSIGLVYSINTQLTAQIKPCIRPNDSAVQWKALESFTSNVITTYQRGPVRSFIQKFTLVYFDSLMNWTDKWTDHKLQIMLRDYGLGGKIKFSGLITINPNGTGPDNNPILSNVSALDSVYAGYYRIFDPPCTLKVSFNYNASKVSAIDISATLDSGKSWIPVSSVTPSGSNAATVVWPLTTPADTGHFNYFGFKECYLKITDKTSDTSINSQTFNIIGNAPFILTSPVGGETFSVSDSIGLVYSINTHLTAQIKPCIRPNDSTIQWKALESFTSSTSTTYQRGPVRSFVQKFTLVYFNDLLNWTDKWADHKLQVMLKDYGSGGKIKFSGLITINPN